MRLDGLFEDLDDKDEFGPQCGYCMQYGEAIGDTNRFHREHEEAEKIAERAAYERNPSRRDNQKYSDIFNVEMWRFGYERRDRGPWFDKPVKEDLDDKDEFGYPAIAAGYHERSGETHHYVIVFEDGSRLYAHTLSSNAGGDYFEKFRDQQGTLHDEHWPGVEEYRSATNQHAAYYKSFTPEIWTDWKSAFGAIKEDLDDKDEFECAVCRANQKFNPKLEIDEFHVAHTTCRQFIGQWGDDPTRYEKEMAKYGYYKDRSIGAWAKR